jgi:hypothetical protein
MKKKNQDKKSGKEIKDGEIPGTFEKQNLGHNAKEEGFSGQHTKR